MSFGLDDLFNFIFKKREKDKETEKGKAKSGFKKNPTREMIEMIIFAVVLALFIRTYVIQAFKIPTGSMESTLLVGDHILVNKFIFSPVPSFLKFLMPTKEPDRGDITVFKYPDNMTRDFVKRLIGLPNEELKIVNKKVYANGERIEFKDKEQYIKTELEKKHLLSPSHIYRRDNFGPEIIPENHYFMMGDNRNNSSDSRVWGFLDRKLIKGRVLLVYFSVTTDKEMLNYKGKKTFLKSILNRIRWNRFCKIIK